MSCKTPNICSNNDFNSLCPECMDVIEEAAIQSALNMGVPEWFGCGYCGGRFSPEEFAKHMVKHAND